MLPFRWYDWWNDGIYRTSPIISFIKSRWNATKADVWKMTQMKGEIKSRERNYRRQEKKVILRERSVMYCRVHSVGTCALNLWECSPHTKSITLYRSSRYQCQLTRHCKDCVWGEWYQDVYTVLTYIMCWTARRTHSDNNHHHNLSLLIEGSLSE
jgi:hypothetical protein